MLLRKAMAKLLLGVLMIGTSAQAQITLSGEKWPWEDKWSDPTRGSILLARSGETDVATLTFEATAVFMVSLFDTTYAARWSHLLPAPEHAISAHIMASEKRVCAVVLTYRDDTLALHGISVEKTTGTVLKQGLIHTMVCTTVNRPIFTTSPSGTHCAMIARNGSDPSTVILFNDDLSIAAARSDVKIEDYSFKLMLRPLTAWVGDNLNIATASVDDSIDVHIAEISASGTRYIQRGVPFISGDDLDVDDCRVEFATGQGPADGNDVFYVIVQERDGSQTDVLVRHRLSLTNERSTHHRYEIRERVRPNDGYTRTIVVNDTAYVITERFSVLYKRQMASNESISIYTVGDGSITRFDPNGVRWSRPLIRGTDTSVAGTSETTLFGATPSVMAVGAGEVSTILYSEDADDFILIQDFDSASGRLKKRTPLTELEGPTYCFLEQWLIIPKHRIIWAPVGTAVHAFRY